MQQFSCEIDFLGATLECLVAELALKVVQCYY